MFKQLYAVAVMSIRSLPQRKGNASVIVLGIAGVVGVLIAILSMAAGFQQTMGATGRDDRFIVLRSGAGSEMGSALTRDEAALIAGMPGIARDKAGVAAVSSEVVTIINLPRRDTGAENSVTLRGVGPAQASVRPEVRIVEGRMFRPELREVIVGRSAAARFTGTAVGNVIRIRNTDWTVVGVFASNGDVHESELFAGADTVAAAVGSTIYTSVFGLLQPGGTLDVLQAALAKETRLKVDVLPESAYLAGQAGLLTLVITTVGNSVAIIMAVGAVFGALNSMYAAVADRRKEIATLRAIGFNPFAVLFAVLFEALLLAFAGGVLGAALAWLLFNGYGVSTLGSSYTQVMFQLQVAPELIVTGITWALLVGLIGGILPALRAARQPIVEGLRAT